MSRTKSRVTPEIEKHRDPITMTRYFVEQRNTYKQASGAFSMLLTSIQLACKVIANANKKAGIANLTGVAGDTNSSGEEQKKLDVLSNDVFINCVRYSGQAYCLVSEEEDEAIALEDTKGGYVVVFDPLDGSSNIDANVSVGTIFGIYKKDEQSQEKTSGADALRPGNQLITAGYCLYGAATMMVITTGLGVNGFTLDPTLGEFILTHPNIRMPESGSIYSCNEGNFESWDQPTQEYIIECRKPKTGKPKKARYIGSMVGDMHRTLLYGGIFMYPASKKDPKGKLRLLYECNPMAMLVEQAGGRATDGKNRILDINPTSLHERSPIYLGSVKDVMRLEQLQRDHTEPKAKL